VFVNTSYICSLIFRRLFVYGPVWDRFGIGLGRFGIDLESVYDRFRIGLASIWDRFGFGLGSFGIHLGSVLNRFAVGLGTIWGRSGIDLGSALNRFGVGLGSICDRFGVNLEQIWDRFGIYVVMKQTEKASSDIHLSIPWHTHGIPMAYSEIVWLPALGVLLDGEIDTLVCLPKNLLFQALRANQKSTYRCLNGVPISDELILLGMEAIPQIFHFEVSMNKSTSISIDKQI
jgi:hypothetical protein